MALTELIFKRRNAFFAAIEGRALGAPFFEESAVITLDASLGEVHDKSITVTRHPIEEGGDVTDHMRPQPVSLELDGIITNHPILFGATLQVRNRGESIKRDEETYKAIEEIADTGRLVFIRTTLKSYDNMAIQALSSTRDASSGNILRIRIGFIRVETALTESTEFRRPINKSRNDVKSDGTKGLGDATTAQSVKAKSAITRIIGF